MIYTEGDNQISINNAVPITEEVGKTLSDENYVFDFTINIKTGPKMPISYEVTAVKDASSTMGNEDVRLYLQKSLDGTNYNDEVLEPSPYTPLDVDDEFGAKAGEMVMDVGTVSEKVTYYYRLRMWVDSSYELSSEAKSFTVKVNVYGKEGGYTSSGTPNPPELVGDMIPVIYDDASNTWVKSSTSKGKWYNYDKQMWANAVTIKDTTKRATYKNAEVGTSIPIEDINTFMVWIPRYSYTLGNTYGYQIEGAETPSQKTPGAFNIKFVDKNTIDMGSGKYTGDKPDNYFTPSSFCWGDTCDDEATREDAGNKELSGIWVSKFEITGTRFAYNDMSSIPNQVSLRDELNYFFENILTYMNNENGLTNYGFSGNYDTHMIKNTEWGAMAYLSQSKYGKYGNKNYSGENKEIYQNKSSEFITGSSNGTPCTDVINTQVAYNVKGAGTGASTTGTIYGIYDTSGGRLEVVMANHENKNNYLGDLIIPGVRYYNLYTGQTSGIKGDAMMRDGTYGWFVDRSYQDYMFEDGENWFLRSGNYDNAFGNIFSFYSTQIWGGQESTRFVVATW